MNGRVGTAWAAVWPPLVFGAAFLTFWQAMVRVLDLKEYFLAPPSDIFQALVDNVTNVREAAFTSGTNAVIGLVAGTLLGVAMSFLLSRYRVLDELVTPLAIALNAIPIVVLVSVFSNMFSTTSEIPRRLMVTLIVYFVVLVNVAKGLTQVSPTQLELMRSYAASDGEILRKVRVPNAVPYFFTALKIAAPGAVITAFVAEYFGGSQNGLGYGISSNVSASRNAIAWAYVVGACLLGLTFYLISIIMEAVATPRGAGHAGRAS